jgi:hypothetical protein
MMQGEYAPMCIAFTKSTSDALARSCSIGSFFPRVRMNIRVPFEVEAPRSVRFVATTQGSIYVNIEAAEKIHVKKALFKVFATDLLT